MLYSFDNGTTWQPANSKNIFVTGPVNIQVKDSLGNMSSTGITITNIDKTAPTCGTRTYSPALNVPTSGKVTATLSGNTDGQS
jgi:hypothetical protein